MSQAATVPNHPLADRRVRGLIGLSGGILIAVVSLLFLEGTVLYLGLAIAVLDVFITPYYLGKAVKQAQKRKATTNTNL